MGAFVRMSQLSKYSSLEIKKMDSKYAYIHSIGCTNDVNSMYPVSWSLFQKPIRPYLFRQLSSCPTCTYPQQSPRMVYSYSSCISSVLYHFKITIWI